MPLIECPDCQHMISDMAPACIHCGRPGRSSGGSADSVTPAQQSTPSHRLQASAPSCGLGHRSQLTLGGYMYSSTRRCLA